MDGILVMQRWKSYIGVCVADVVLFVLTLSSVEALTYSTPHPSRLSVAIPFLLSPHMAS